MIWGYAEVLKVYYTGIVIGHQGLLYGGTHRPSRAILCTERKKNVVRNLKRVPRIATNSKPFLGFVRIRFRKSLLLFSREKGFRTSPFFPNIEKKGFVVEVSYKTILPS